MIKDKTKVYFKGDIIVLHAPKGLLDDLYKIATQYDFTLHGIIIDTLIRRVEEENNDPN